jgi:MFS family permease
MHSSSVEGRGLVRFLGLRRNIVLLLASLVIIGTGEELWMRFLPKYLEALGASVFLIGLFDGIKTLLGALYAYPGGVIADKWGVRKALIAFTVATMAGYLILLLVPDPSGVLLGMFLFLGWSLLSLPATFSLVGSTLPPDQHSMGIGVQSLVKRVPIVVGPVAGGMLIDRLGIFDGVRTGVILSILFAAGALGAQASIREDDGLVAPPVRDGVFQVLRSFPPELKRLLFSDILIRFCERIPAAWIVIYALDHVRVSASAFGVLISIEMIAAMMCYIPASHLADRYGKDPFVIATFIFFTLFPLSLAFAGGFPGLCLAFAIRGLKEFGEPARKALIIGYAPPASRGQSIGAYYLVRDTVVSVGAIAGAALWSLGAQVNLGSAFAVGVAGTLIYTLYGRKRV